MSATVIIPTLWKRPALLNRCIESIANSSLKASLHLSYGNKGYATTVNKALREVNPEFVLMGNDDQEYYPSCISIAAGTLISRFPDLDGMVGIRQEHGGTIYAITLIGRAFVNRFRSRAIFCPDYTNYYQDQELYEYAKSVGKFYFCEKAVAIHHMPGDETRAAMNSTREEDKRVWATRREKGLLWGSSFNQINT